MKKLYLLSALLMIGTAVLLFTSCETITGGSPTSFAIEAATDSTVKLTWAVPAEGTPDNYIVYFKEVGTSAFVEVQQLGGTVLTYTDNPSGKTGTYYVAAKFGSNKYESDEKTTIPIHGTSTSLSELNATGNSGYGWTRADGAAGAFSMTSASNASSVDFYLTNFAANFTTVPYNIASPDMGPTDAGGVVPTGGWRVNAISNPLTDPQAALPTNSTTTYFNYTPLSAYPSYLGVYTTDGYYALIKIDGLNSTAGTVTVESWIQLVKGLRLIQH
jgi:hypothetical protein